MEGGRLLLRAQWRGAPVSRIHFTPFSVKFFGFLGVCEVRSRSDTERVTTAFPPWGGLCCFRGRSCESKLGRSRLAERRRAATVFGR